MCFTVLFTMEILNAQTWDLQLKAYSQMLTRAFPVPHNSALCWSYFYLCGTPRQEKGAAFLGLAHFQARTAILHRASRKCCCNKLRKKWGGFQLSPFPRGLWRCQSMYGSAIRLKWVGDVTGGARGNLHDGRSLMPFIHTLFPGLLCACTRMHVCLRGQVFANACVESRGHQMSSFTTLLKQHSSMNLQYWLAGQGAPRTLQSPPLWAGMTV